MIRAFLKAMFYIFVLTLIGPVFGQSSSNIKTKVTGVYSNMDYNIESGDVLGQEIFIVFSKDGYFAVLQNSEGEPTPPVIVPVKIRGQKIHFHIPSSMDARGNFDGAIANGELTGTFSGNSQRVELKRKNSYWQ